MIDNSFSILNEAVKHSLDMKQYKRPDKDLLWIRRKYESGEDIKWLENELIKHYKKIKKELG